METCQVCKVVLPCGIASHSTRFNKLTVEHRKKISEGLTGLTPSHDARVNMMSMKRKPILNEAEVSALRNKKSLLRRNRKRWPPANTSQTQS